jgi:WD40 repeat protein
VKLLDLGLARLSEPDNDGESSSTTLTESGAVLGTPDYIAPEQARKSHSVDIRADLYSLGCTGYFLLTGRPPFPGGTLGQKLVQQMMDEPQPLRELRPEVPDGVAAVIAKLMAKRPEQRYQTPAELATVLEVGLRTGNWPGPAGDTASCDREGAEDSPSVTAAGFCSVMHPQSRPAVNALWRQRQAAGKRRWLLLNGLGVVVLLAVAAGVVFLLRRPEPPPTERPGPKTEEERASEALQPLQARAVDPATDRDKLRQELIAFPMAFPGTKAAWEAGVLLRQLPSPLDDLRREKLPESERPPWQPAEVVQVLGDHRGRHWSPVWAVALTPDGKLAAASDGRDIVLWDTATMCERLRWRAHDSVVNALCFAEGGRVLVSTSDDKTLCRWELPAAKLVRQLRTKTWLSYLSTDGKRGLGGDGKNIVCLYDLENGTVLQQFEGHTDQVTAGTLSADGKRALTGGTDKMVRLWDTATGKELAYLKGHTAAVTGVAFTPDGKNALSADGGPGARIRYWDLKTAKQIWEGQAGPHGSRFVVLPDGKQALEFGDGVRLWNLDTGKEVRRLDTVRVQAAALSADGRLALTVGGMVSLWDLQTGQQLHTSDGPPSAVMQVLLTPDGRQAVSSYWLQTSAGVWDVVTGKQLGGVKAEVHHLGIALSPDGRRLLGGQWGTLYLWEVPSGKPRATWKVPWLISCLAFSPDGQQALLGTHTQSQQGGQLTYGDYNVRLIDLRSGKELKNLPGHRDTIRSVAFSPDGRLALSSGGHLAVSSDNALRLWDLQSGRLLRTLAGHKHCVSGLAFSPDGRRFASCSSDTTVRLWELEGPRSTEPLVLQAGQPSDYRGTDGVSAVAFAPDGQTLASATSFGRITIWDLSGKKRKEWQLPGVVQGLSFAADGRHLATANNNGTVYIFRLAPAPAR